jgi:beta-phosphoglucomutase-like phosphatase (HAD superfamily)
MPRPGAVEALIWDFDGTVADTEAADARAWREEFTRAGAPASLDEYARWWLEWSWRREVPMIDRLAARAPGIDRGEVQARRLGRYLELCRGLPARPGVAGWMARAGELGLRQAVATNDADGRAAAHLARLGLDRHVDAVVTAADGGRRKPFPDLYIRALGVLGALPAAAVAVEDSPHGIAAAKAAGLRVVAVPGEVTAGLDLGAADLVVPDPPAMRLDDVLGTVRTAR